MSKIYLTGHDGFIGRHLVKKLQELNHEVVTDFRYFNDKFDAVIHLAAVTHIRDEFDPKMIESNIILADKIFKKNCRIIYASSCSAAHFTNPYAWTKMWSEYLGEKHGNAVGLRFFNCYGPGNNKGIVKFLMDQPDGARIKIRGVDLVRDYIHVDDIVNDIVKPHLLPEGKYVDLQDLRKEVEDGGDIKDLIKMAFDGRRKHIDLLATVGVVDVGTGVGTSTMDLVNLYMKLSGKSFIIDIEEPGRNEPVEMVSNRKINSISLEEGLQKMINEV